MKIKRTVLFSIVLVLAIICSVVYLEYSRMYTTGSNDIVVKERLFDSHLDFGVSDAYNVGLNADNEIIFKDKNAALKQIYTDYKDGFEYLRKQSLILKLSKFNWRRYQLLAIECNPSDDYYSGLINSIDRFFDVYENSFKMRR
ncbi:hypothetical protein [Lachnotalea sp. AF33-28]|uniref:hypothetical protein n=1 Tax=Lachnotalea sp. AF33-28 TaxID=2292046 RepID=UPI000E534251|nr:hypothetical protein [Lachnotalea sp. AF33-28]RHP33357.1 hypothetical protein DWZ56_12000 [Lachnotalea sp. AF33-28]